MALESATLFGQFANASKRKDLKAAAIGQDWSVPTIELVQTASLLQYLCTGTKVEMIGVAQNNLSLDFIMEVAISNTFHAANRTDRHEDGRLDLAVVGRDETSTSIGKFICLLYLKRHNIYDLTIYDLPLSFSSSKVNVMGFFTFSSSKAKSSTS